MGTQPLKTFHFVLSKLTREQELRFNELKHFHLPIDDINAVVNIPLYLVAKILAEKANVSNLQTFNWQSPKVIKSFEEKNANTFSPDSSPSILTYFGLFFYKVYNPLYQWERFRSSSQKPIFVMTEIKYWNFVYCDSVQRKKEPIWSISVLTNVFDPSTWVFLIIAMLGIGLTLGIQKYGENMMRVLSGVLGFGTHEKLEKRGLTFIIFLLLIRIIIDMYSGKMSSLMISPPEEISFKNLLDLNNANYSMVTRAFDETAERLAFLSHLTSNETGVWVNPQVLLSKSLHQRVLYVFGSNRSANFSEIAKFLVTDYGRKIAYIDDWYSVMWFANQIESRRNAGDTSLQNGALCHVGTEQDDGGPYYWAFLPPNHEELAKNFQRILESGIFDLMMRENIGLRHSVRVQDRNRVKSRTYIEMDTRRDIEKGSVLNHKLAKVFFLWTVCVGACVVLTIAELSYSLVIKKYKATLGQDIDIY